MTLNIDAKQSTIEAPGAVGATSTPVATPVTSRGLRDEVLQELTSWNPREFITAFQRWHQGTVSLTHLNVLTLLEAFGPMSMSRLAESLDVSVASMTGIVDRMEKRGLVRRRRDENDRRVVLVQPAAGGRKVFGEIDGRRRAGLGKLLDHLSDEDLKALLAGHRARRAARQALAANMTDPKPGTNR